MKRIPDWALQAIWFMAGIFATGALWYFISIKNTTMAVISLVCAIFFALLAIYLHRSRDSFKAKEEALKREKERLYREIVLNVGEERITFQELHRSSEYDIIKVNANQHFLGVASEHFWIRERYPDAEMEMQSLTTLDRLKYSESKESEAKKIHFDIFDIIFPNGRKKKIYFDISSFFNGLTFAKIDPNSKVAHKLNDLYK
jgi:ABC-type multidrug transport system fused ATPase/permease subunit